MLKPRAYVETTIPSFYYETRRTPEIIARRHWTRQWWQTAADRYELVTSPAVLEELAAGPVDRSKRWLALLSDMPLLEVDSTVVATVETYLKHKLMPGDPAGDALHLALASHHQCDFLVTWNCEHLANANKFGHIRKLNSLLGLFVPALVTPLELLGGQT